MPEPRVETVTTTTELAALEGEWTELWRRAPAATPFQTPAWLMPWWRQFGNDGLHVLTARADGQLVGLLPLYLLREPGGAKLLPVGIGVSDYLDGIFEPGSEHAAAAAFIRHLTAEPCAWDVCELRPLPPDSPLLEASDPSGRPAEVTALEPCPSISIPEGARDLREVLSARIRTKLRNYGRRAERQGAVRFETASSAAGTGRLLEALIALHAKRWAEDDRGGVFADARVGAFHRAAAPALQAAGLLRLHALCIENRVVAVIYALAARRCLYCYLTGFDPEFAAISPGTLLLGYAVEQAMHEHARVCDFLRGREPYKYLWGGRDRPTFARMLRPRGQAQARSAAPT
jgi:CelD/BcsL family acetyltransferase involved in cellulose biosynthesis